MISNVVMNIGPPPPSHGGRVHLSLMVGGNALKHTNKPKKMGAGKYKILYVRASANAIWLISSPGIIHGGVFILFNTFRMGASRTRV